MTTMSASSEARTVRLKRPWTAACMNSCTKKRMNLDHQTTIFSLKSFCELRNPITIAYLVTRSAAMRKESRACTTPPTIPTRWTTSRRCSNCLAASRCACLWP